MSLSSSSGSAHNIEISNVFVKSHRIMTSVKLSIDSITFKRDFKGSKEATLTLAPDRPSLPSSTPLIVQVRLDRFFNKTRCITVERQHLLSNAGTTNKQGNLEEYRTTVDEIEVVIKFILSGLRPTTDGIFERCPRFRVLVIGRTGAGKTSLIRNTFGIKEALVSDKKVGECDINEELTSEDENKRFVLHDSKGFEPGDEDSYDTVMKFLNERKEKPDIKDQVHAIWLCFSIPIRSERLFETGAEKFLQLLSDGQLDQMPVIATFTKYDKLVDDTIIYHSGDAVEPDEKIEAVARARLDELCVEPFRQKIGKKTDIPTIAVSTAENYERTLHELTQLTTELVGKHLSEDVAVLSAVAQQVSPTVKLDAVIAVGKKRYWTILASTVKLSGNEPETVLQNIHQDIITIFNLQDPKELLDSKVFKSMVAGIVSQEDVLSLKQMATSLSMLGALAAVVTALSGPVAPIVLPIAATLVVGHWTVLLLKQANIVLQRLMTYIVALTLIMQVIFAITTSTKNVVSRRLVKVAVKAFLDSPQPGHIHSAIKQHLHRHPGALLGRESVLENITELIQLNRMSSDDVAEIKNMMKDFDISHDESWY